MKSIFLRLFPSNTHDINNREPDFYFAVPGVVGTFGFLNGSPLFAVQSFFLLMTQTVIHSLVAAAMYALILVPQKKKNSKTDGPHHHPQFTYVVVYGIIGPLLMFLPLCILHYWSIQNTALILLFFGNTVSVLFCRCLEVMHGTLPPFAEKSFRNFMIYFASPCPCNFDPKTHKVMAFKRKELISRSFELVRSFGAVTILFSVLMPCNYNLFPRKPTEGLLDLFYWGNLLNNYIMLWLVFLLMESGSVGLSLQFSLVSGWSTRKTSYSPLTASTSPSDFWGKRWNQMTGNALRRGVYQPLRNNGTSAKVAALATFVVSGLIHEYLLLLISLGPATAVRQEPYSPSFGRNFVFFLWNGGLLIGEHLFSEHTAVLWIRRNLPKQCRALLVVAMSLPVGHYFSDEYVASGLFSDTAVGYPRIVYENS